MLNIFKCQRMNAKRQPEFIQQCAAGVPSMLIHNSGNPSRRARASGNVVVRPSTNRWESHAKTSIFVATDAVVRSIDPGLAATGWTLARLVLLRLRLMSSRVPPAKQSRRMRRQIAQAQPQRPCGERGARGLCDCSDPVGLDHVITCHHMSSHVITCHHMVITWSSHGLHRT